MLVIVVLVTVIVAFVCHNSWEANEISKDNESGGEISEMQNKADPQESSPPEPITATLAVAGDIVAHMPLNRQAYQVDTQSYDYREILGGSVPLISAADYAVCCLETTFTHSGEYSGYPSFTSPHDLAGTLRDVGFDLLFLASNHSMDKGKSGLDTTLDVLDEYGLSHTGTYRTQEEADETNGVFLTDVGGISVCFINYTYGTNGIPVTTYPYCVNIFLTDYLDSLVTVDYDRLNRSLDAAKAMEPDIIAVGMHWGSEYNQTPNSVQEEMSDYLFANGVDLVLGGHPHSPQPMERRTVSNDDGSTGDGFIVYSLGNYISCQKDPFTNLTAILNITMEKDSITGETVLKQIEYVPMFMMDAQLYGMTGVPRYSLLDIYEWIEKYEAGDNTVTTSLYNALKTGLENLHGVLGAEFDYKV